MNQSQQNETVNPNNNSNPQGFCVGVTFSNKGVDISPQGTLSLSYQQLWSAIATLIVAVTGWVSLSPQLPNPNPNSPYSSPTNQVHE